MLKNPGRKTTTQTWDKKTKKDADYLLARVEAAL